MPRYGAGMAGRILVGTSSWADPGFVEEWYPPGMPARDRLAWYAERFEAVEVNSSFYAVPEQGTVARWAQVTPDGFTFDVKLHRLLSRHAATLKSLPPDLRDDVETNGRGRVRLTPEIELALADRILEAVEPLDQAGKLGAFLLQLTPAFSPDEHELDELDALIERARAPRRSRSSCATAAGWRRSASRRRSATCPSTAPPGSRSTPRPATTCRSCPPVDAVTHRGSPTCACTAATPRAT